MIRILAIVTLIGLAVAIAGMCVTVYYMWGASMYRRATAAYLRHDIREGDRWKAKADRWMIGIKP